MVSEPKNGLENGPGRASTIKVGASGVLVSLVASGRARSRQDLAKLSGRSRATVSQQLAELLADGLVEERAMADPTGRGRPVKRISLRRDLARILVADIGEDHIRVALTDMQSRIRTDGAFAFDMKCGPVPTLTRILEEFRRLLAGQGCAIGSVAGIGISLPAPVDFDHSSIFGPSVMTGWDGFDIRGWFFDNCGIPVVAENDVRLMTVAEQRTFWPDTQHMLFVKAGTGIGCGIVMSGQICRGANGAASDIGHIQLRSDHAPLCRCGKFGCVEARAAGWALSRDLAAEGIEAHTASDVVRLTKEGKPEAIRSVREAGRVLGEVICNVVSVLNPSLIVVGGTLSQTGDHLMSGVRELVYQRSLPLAVRGLRIETAKSGNKAALIGAAHLVIESQTSPEQVEGFLKRLGSGEAFAL